MTKARVNADNASADIQGVTAGTGLTGGGTSGTVTLTNDMATAIDAKGDLVVGTGADTYDNLAVGNNGETLLANSASSTGLSWGNNLGFTAGKNKLINGDFGIWQRGTSFSGNAVYTSDRWLTDGDRTGCAVSRQTFTPASAPVSGYEGQFYARYTPGTGGTYSNLQQRIEDVRTFAGQTVTLSYWARISTGTITNEPAYIQNFGSGGSGSNSIVFSSVTITTTWQRFTHTLAIDSISGKTVGTSSYLNILPLRITSASSANIDIWGVQLEAGSVATAFQTATGTLAGELALAQRYYEKSYDTETAPANTGGQGKINFNTPNRTDQYAIEFNATFRVTKRALPTVTIYSPSTGTAARVRDEGSGNDRAAVAKNIGFNNAQIEGDSGVTTTANALHSFQWVASAEL